MRHEQGRRQNMKRLAILLLCLGLFAFIHLLSLYGPSSSTDSMSAEEQEASGYASADKGWKKKGLESVNDSKGNEEKRPLTITIPIEEMKRSIRESRQEFDEAMQNLYGQSFFPLIFHRVHDAFELHNISRSRFMRRLNIKLLSAYLHPSLDTTFTWVTGGHSNAAAHGNLYNHSYTATLERYARKAFQSVGLDFAAKNYAMGGYSSGIEISLCLESVYGQHFDFFSWDFGMTDGQDIFKLQLLLNRITTAANFWSIDSADQLSYFPIVLVIGANGPRRNAAIKAEDFGMATLLSTPSPILEDLKANIPDASIHDQGNLTDYLANFVCSGNFESNDPCGKDEVKYRTEPCKHVKGQVSWHDGWKLHHLYGVLYADLMVQLLQEAIDELAILLLNQTNVATTSSDHSIDPLAILSHLQEEERNDRISFLSVNASETVEASFLAGLSERITLESIARKRSICHTALLPSQARYDGIVTGSGNRKKYLEDFDVGVSKADIIGEPLDFYTSNDTYLIPRSLPLVFDEDLRHPCDMLLKIDYKDVFLVRGGAGWVSAVIPNDSEIDTYVPKRSKQQHSSKKKSDAVAFHGSKTFSIVPSSMDILSIDNNGLISICLEVCDWGQCPSYYLSLPDDLKRPGQNSTEGENKLAIEVDEKAVVDVVRFNGNCFLLEGEQNGLNWGEGNDKGQYELKFNIDGHDKHLHISSVIIL